FALGALWYGPLFSKPWLRSLGKTETDMQGGPPIAPLLIAQFVATVITATVLALIIERFGPGVTTGVIVGLLCGAGFVATAKLSDVLFSQTATSTRYWIEAGNQIVSYALMGAVYGFFA
ncbi:MAG TPA: DUF1761 domain-containing protein, partial [Candidatus Limnocylindria bacterium]|nr:DUF1761 domain-containing protein [Candidatus Limnocylindria bacterium]